MTEAREYEIADINYTNIKRDGSEMKTKNGEPMWLVNLKIPERPETWISGLVFREPKDWKGSKQKLILYAEEYNGKPQAKFKLPPSRAAALSNEKLDQIIELLGSIDETLRRIEKAPTE